MNEETGTSKSSSQTSRYTVNSDSILSDNKAETTEPSIVSVLSNGQTRPRQLVPTKSPRVKQEFKQPPSSPKPENESKSVSIYTVNTSIFTVRSDHPYTTPDLDAQFDPKMHSTKLSDGTSHGISSLPSDAVYDFSYGHFS